MGMLTKVAPELPVHDLAAALVYYTRRLGSVVAAVMPEGHAVLGMPSGRSAGFDLQTRSFVAPRPCATGRPVAASTFDSVRSRMKMETRQIQERDIPAILDLVADTMTRSTQKYIDEYRADLERHMRYYLRHEDKSAQQVVLDGEKVIGFALAGVMPEEDLGKYFFIDHSNPREPLSWILLEQITVHAAYRGEKIGSMLLARVTQRAREMGLKGVYTGTRGNTRLFYEKNGFILDKVYLKRPV